MFKKATVLFFILLSLSCTAQDITATQKIPANVMPGTDFIVETTIKKASNSGFMKFYQELPIGFSATDIDSKNGSFTFDNGAKVVWLSPPSDETFTISYKVTVAAGITGTKQLSGKISYIVNNERKTYDLAPTTIIVGKATAAPVKNETPKPAPVSATPAPVAKTTPVTATPSDVKEVKKEAPQPAPVFTKVPSTALPSSPGKTYRVQIGAYAAKPKIDGVQDVTTIVLDNGITKYFSGNFTTYEEAVKRKKELADKGFLGAFIVSFENGKIVK